MVRFGCGAVAQAVVHCHGSNVDSVFFRPVERRQQKRRRIAATRNGNAKRARLETRATGAEKGLEGRPEASPDGTILRSQDLPAPH